MKQASERYFRILEQVIGVSVESASMLEIKITPVINFVSADLRQAVAEALA